MLGDTAVAVNPEGRALPRPARQDVRLPLMDRDIPIIADEVADPEFGTGVVKVTPAHDPNDFEAGKRHNLPKIQVIDETGHMTAAAGAYAGLDRFEARKRVVDDLEKLGLIEKIEPYELSLGPLPALQDAGRAADLHAVVRQDQAARRARHQGGRRGPHPVHARELDQDLLRVDAQHPRLVHLAPALVGPPHPGLVLPRLRRDHRFARRPHRRARCGSGRLEQDPDVLDTWFSSGALAVLHARLAGPDRGPQDLLSDIAADHRLRHPLLLGGADDHDRASSSWATCRSARSTSTRLVREPSARRCPRPRATSSTRSR